VYTSNEAERSEVLNTCFAELLESLFEIDKKVCEKLKIFEFEKEECS